MAGFANDVMVADNVNFTGLTGVPGKAATVTTDKQLLIGSSAAPHIRVGTLTSPLGTLSIGYSSPDITLDVAAVQLNYTNVTHAMSPYTVLSTDYFISVDCSAGVVILNFPNAPTFKQEWIIKDRTGNAAVSNITITTPGGTVTFDGLTSYVMNSNYQAINLLANLTPTYEVF